MQSTRDPDVAYGMARFLHELGMTPAIIANGTEIKEFALGRASGRKPDRA